MKKAIEFLRSKGIAVTDNGIILSELPTGIDGISLTDALEEKTSNDDFCYTIFFDARLKKDILYRQYF